MESTTLRRIMVPLVLVGILLLAGATRWRVTASTSDPRGMVIRWVLDRWTGETWIRTYLPNKVEERPGSVRDDGTSDPILKALRENASKRAAEKRDGFTVIYYVVLGLVATWLVAAADYKTEKQHETPNKETPPEGGAVL